jgi:triosephosphate isomerase (TIM)
MTKPLLMINTKAYKEGTGEHAVKLAKICRKLFRTSKAEIILSVQPSDIPSTSGIVTTYAQHVDGVDPGSHTGHILTESVRAAGAKGTLLNHSERRLDFKQIRSGLARARQNGMKVVVCVPYTVMVSKIAATKPDFIAIEPPELIGTGVSVSKAKPYVVSRAVDIVRESGSKTRLLCGAGISTPEDVAKALELGAEGVLLASSVVKARDPEKVIKDLLKGF